MSYEMGDIFRPSGNKIVHANDFMALVNEKVGNMATKKSSATRNQNSHEHSLSILVVSFDSIIEISKKYY